MNRRSGEGSSAQSGTQLRAAYAHALARVESGALVPGSTVGASVDRLESLAATLPALFGPDGGATLSELREQLGGEPGPLQLREIVVISKDHVHVIEPLPRNPGVALLMVTAATSTLGLVLSAVHAKLAEFEGE